MKHIDRKSLYTSLEARIAYLHDFLDFNSDDLAALALGAKFVKDLIPAVVHLIYRKLLNYDITARAFQFRDTRGEGPVEDQLDENSPELKQRKMFLNSYLAKICSDQSQMAFWEYLDNVGAMHVGLKRVQPLHVEYIHINATLCLIQNLLNESILTYNGLPMSKRIAMVRALGKVIWIQNDLFSKWCVRDGEEFLKDLQDEKAKTGACPMAMSAGDSEKPAVCPMTGLTKTVEKLTVVE
ncbi:hypothetical protein Cpir12675_006756 [Ceratocystis pirilliformis]|uniref:Globin-sensor domain-containing protein n=1 Tax=Ceratocystis pirilliformis TaxID=259994 RepID=A0ABR3YGC6_9PEZI